MLIRLLRSHLRPYKRLLIAVVCLQAVQTVATLTLPTLNARIIDNGILKHNQRRSRVNCHARPRPSISDAGLQSLQPFLAFLRIEIFWVQFQRFIDCI